MRQHLEQYPLLTSLIIVLSIIIITILAVTPYFDTNDDAGLMLITSGRVLSPTPSGEAYWLHPFLSHTLASLYRFAPDMPWYGLMHVSSLVLAFWSILYALLLNGFSWRQLALFLICLVAFGLPSVISLQFTKTAFLVGLGGLFLCAMTLQQSFTQQGTSRLMRLRLGGGLLLLVLSLMIRRESLYLVAALSVPLIVFLAWSARKSQSLLFFLTILTGLSLLLFALASVHARAYTRSPEWIRFQRLLQLKAEFLDYAHIPYNAQTEPYFREVGWSENDYLCLRRWFYIDPKIYSPEKLQAIVAHFPPTTRSRADIRRAVLALHSHFRADRILWLLLPLWLSIILLGIHSRPHLLTSLATGLGALLGMALLATFFYLPDRVFHPVVTSVCWFALLFSEESHTSGIVSRQSWLRQCGGLLCVGITLLLLLTRADTSLAKIVTFSGIVRQQNADLHAALVHLNPHPSQTFVVWGAAFPFESILPLEHQGYLRNFRILGLGASNQSPIQQRMLEAQGIEDLPRALFERRDVFLILIPERGEATLLERYLAEHYGVTAKVIPHRQEGALRLWKVTLPQSPAEMARERRELDARNAVTQDLPHNNGNTPLNRQSGLSRGGVH